MAKPLCTRLEPDGGVSSRGHSWRGAVRARQILWRTGVPFRPREHVCALVRHHLVPFYASDGDDPRRLAIEVSQSTRCDWLTILAESDVRGRVCPDPDHLIGQVRKFREVAAEAGCLDRPFPFAGDHERFAFFRATYANPTEGAAGEPPTVVLMSGLPGAGKDYWIATHLPKSAVVSLDQLRLDLGVPPSDPRGEALRGARELARLHLKAGRSFVWNAANLSRHVRSDCVKLFGEYGARVRMVYVEVGPERLYAQNRARKRRVPEPVIERMLDRWEVPDPTEAHRVEWVVG